LVSGLCYSGLRTASTALFSGFVNAFAALLKMLRELRLQMESLPSVAIVRCKATITIARDGLEEIILKQKLQHFGNVILSVEGNP
jgi:hypothetical protein